MTVNDFLCEHFETDEDGDVTVRSILNGILCLSSLVFVSLAFTTLIGLITTDFFNQVGLIPHNVIGSVGDISVYNLFLTLCAGISVIILLFITVTAVMAILSVGEFLLSMSVASCPKKPFQISEKQHSIEKQEVEVKNE